MPGATSRCCSTPRPRSSSRPGSRRRCATSPRGPGSAWAPSTATSPTRADLIVAVYRHQVEACAEAGPALLAAADSPFDALRQWIDRFVDFLVTKHGLAGVMRSDASGFDALHAYFLDRLVPVCDQLLHAATEAGEVRVELGGLELMYAVGNLCAGGEADPRYGRPPASSACSSRGCVARRDRGLAPRGNGLASRYGDSRVPGRRDARADHRRHEWAGGGHGRGAAGRRRGRGDHRPGRRAGRACRGGAVRGPRRAGRRSGARRT